MKGNASKTARALIGVLLQYERLSTYCYLCGKMDHKGVHCHQYPMGHIDEVKSPFRVWLKAGHDVQ